MYCLISIVTTLQKESSGSFYDVKTYLRSTMTQSRLNHLLILHCHKDRTDSLSLTECLQEFVDCRERRTDVFGKFK